MHPPKGNMSTQTSGKDPSHRHESSSHLFAANKRSYHPLSLVVFIIWTGFTIVLVSILEYAVQHQSLAFSGNARLWQQAPGLLITLFAQGHVTVTAWHLGCLGISAFQDPRFAPKTWLEMFWMATNKWQNPINWIKTIYSARKQRLRLSVTFGAFVVSVLFAFPTPLLLKRAYPFLPLELEDPQIHWSNVWSMVANKPNAFDPFTQLSVGQNSWSSGLNVNETYPTRVFQPYGLDDSTMSSLGEVLFSADVYPGAKAKLPGVRAKGGCKIVESQSPDQSLDLFHQLCKVQDFGLDLDSLGFMIEDKQQMTFFMDACYNSHNTTALGLHNQGLTYWNSTPFPPDESALVWIYLNDYGNKTATQGVIQCDLSITTGVALLDVATQSGRRSFQDLTVQRLFQPLAVNGSGAIPYFPPLFTALSSIMMPLNGIPDGNDSYIVMSQLAIEKAKMFGFTISDHMEGARQQYRKPSLNAAAAALWSGALHMTAAINEGASTYKQEPLEYHQQIPWWTQDPTYRSVTWATLAVWLATVMILTAFLYRPTFASSMDCYIIARICAERPDLFTGDEIEELNNNVEMQQQFMPLVVGISATSQLGKRKMYGVEDDDVKENVTDAATYDSLLPMAHRREAGV